MKKHHDNYSGPRRASARCFAGLPIEHKKRPREAKPELFGPFPPHNGPARFVDYASDSVAHSLTGTFVYKNAELPLGKWVAPSVENELDAIFLAMLCSRTYKGEIFADAMHWEHRELFVAIIDVDVTTEDRVEVPAGTGFGKRAEMLTCHPIKVLASASFCQGKPAPKLPVFRWNKAKGCFSLLKGKRAAGTNYVRGPYLVVAIYEPSSMVVAKVRLWPVWFCPVLQRMNIVRSNLERGGAAALATMGAVGCTFISRAQLCSLQEGLGHRWEGDVGTYPYQPDYVIMPLALSLPIVTEVFGVRQLKRYDVSKAAKKSHGRENAKIRFTSIGGQNLTMSEVSRQMVVLACDPANRVWLQTRATGEAA